MMRFSRPTLILAGIAAFLLLVLLVDHGASRPEEALPRLPAIPLDDVTRVTFTRMGETTLVSREGDAWRITQPLQADADANLVQALLATFKNEVSMDLRVDRGNLDKYGVDDNAGVTFEVFTAAPEPIISMVVGNDLTGGSTLVRLAGSDAVYRSHVGGRFQYDRAAVDWRNRTVLGVDADAFETLALTRAADHLTFRRAPSADPESKSIPWILGEDPTFPVDQKILEALVRSLASLRATAIHAPGYGAGWDDPVLTLDLSLRDGTTHDLLLVPADNDDALVRVDDHPDVYRIPGVTLRRFKSPLADFRDRTIFAFSPTDIDAISLESGSNRVRLKQDLTSGAWKIVEPVNTDAAVRQAVLVANTLASLRADRVISDRTPATAGLERPTSRLTVDLLDGSHHVLELGDTFSDEAGTEFRYARTSEGRTLFGIRESLLVQLRKAFLLQ